MPRSEMPGLKQLGPEPARTRGDVIGSAYALILLTAGASITFNVYDNIHSGVIKIGLGIIGGLLPPACSALLSHIAASTKIHGLFTAAVFILSALAMVVSAFAVASVLQPVHGVGVAIAFAILMDGSSMACLTVIVHAHRKSTEWKQWHTSVAELTATLGSGNRDVAGSQNPGKAPGSGCETPAGSGSGGSAGSGNPAGPSSGDKQKPGPDPQRDAARTAAKEAASRIAEELIAEYASRERPAAESTETREARLRDWTVEFLGDFARRVGAQTQPTNAHLGKALKVSKADAGRIRNALKNEGRIAA